MEIDKLTTDNLRWLRLHGFALVYYGGKALHEGVGAPTEEKTWRSALDGLVASLTLDGRVSVEQARELTGVIESTLFDLDAVEPASAGAAVAAAISNATAKV